MKTYKTTVLILVPALLLLSSCTREEVIDSNAWKRQSDHICFGISPKTENVLTKGGSDHLVMRSADSDDTLCVRVTVSDGIDGQPFAEKAPGTRAAQITSIGEYGGFHVQAHSYTDSYTGSTLDEEFYINDDVTIQNDNIWSTALMYFWPGTGRTLNFYAWAPADAGDYGLTAPLNPNETTLAYTVPSDVTEQKDISVATATGIPGDCYSAVPLTFNHIFTAVRFVIGDQMQPGTIERVALTGVYDRGTYDMAAAEGSNPWELGATVADFSQLMTFPTTGNETYGEAITSNEGTFMMLPQTLPDGAEIQIVFLDNATGTERTLTASIAGSEWPMGKTVTYKISISPEYELEFISEPMIQDAHYIIYPIHIKASEMPGEGGWTMTSTDNSVTLRTSLTILTGRGFWIEEERGEISISSTAVGEDITVYAFLEENIGEETREVKLELRPTSLPNAVPSTFTISQLCPSWNGDIGCERIEDGDYPWGFLWEDNLEISYIADNLSLGQKAILWFYLHLFNNDEFVYDNTWDSMWGGEEYTVTINFNNISDLNVAKDYSDGKKNTWETYNFDGINDASSMMDMLKEWGLTADRELPTNPTEFAARICALKNKFNIRNEIGEDGEQAVIAYLKEENLQWYLPAKDEAHLMTDNEKPLDGEYWTSTAANDNQNAFMYSAESGTTAIEQRDQLLHVRAVRKRP